MISVAQLQVVVGADIAGALGGLNKLNSAVSSAAGFFGRAASTAAGFIGGALGLQALQGVAQGLNSAIFGMNSTLQGAAISFGVLLGSADAAQAHLADLTQFAQTTPFDLPQVLQGSQRLLAYGFSAGEVIPTLTRLGNIASGLNLGEEGLNRMVVATGQIHTAGRVLQQDLNQLQSVGINTGQIFEIMAKQTGISVPALKKMQAAGTLTSATFEKAFAVFAEQKFGGLMAKQSATLVGAMSNIRDALGIAGAKAFKPLFDAVQSLALRFATFLGTAQFQAWVDKVAVGVGQLVAWFQTTLPAAWAMLQPKLAELATWLQTNIPAAWAALSPKLSEFAGWLQTNLPAAWAVLQPKLAELVGWLQDTLPKAGQQLGSMWADLQPKIAPVVPLLGSAASALATIAKASVDLAVADLGNTLTVIAAAGATLAAPGLIAGAAAFVAMAAAAAPLWLLAGAVALIALTIKQQWPAIADIGVSAFTKIVEGIKSVIQWGKVAAGVLLVLTTPSILQGTGLSIGNVLKNATVGQDLFTLMDRQKNPVFGADTGALLGPATAGGAAVTTVNNDFSGMQVNASDPADVQRFLDQVAAAAAAGQASAANTAPAVLVGGS